MKKFLGGALLAYGGSAFFYLYLYLEHPATFPIWGVYLSVSAIASVLIGKRLSVVVANNAIIASSAIIKVASTSVLSFAAISLLLLVYPYDVKIISLIGALNCTFLPLSAGMFELSEIQIVKLSQDDKVKAVNFVRMGRVILFVALFFGLSIDDPVKKLIVADLLARTLIFFATYYSWRRKPSDVSKSTKAASKFRILQVSSLLNASSIAFIPLVLSYMNLLPIVSEFYIAQRIWGGASTIYGKSFMSYVVNEKDRKTNGLRHARSLILRSFGLTSILNVAFAFFFVSLLYFQGTSVDLPAALVVLYCALRFTFSPILQLSNLLGKLSIQFRMEVLRLTFYLALGSYFFMFNFEVVILFFGVVLANSVVYTYWYLQMVND